MYFFIFLSFFVFGASGQRAIKALPVTEKKKEGIERLFFSFNKKIPISLGDRKFQKKKKKNSVRIQPVWSIKFSSKPSLKPKVIQNTQPLVLGDKVIQGDSFSGIKAFHRKTGRLVWETPFAQVKAASSMVSLGDVIYFGGSDGFFYAVDSQTGRLIWKFFTGSENVNSPLVYGDAVYWMASNQKIYARSLKKEGKLLWIYSGPSLPRGLFARGSSGLAIKDSFLYGGFYDGSVVALDRKSGKKKWFVKGKPSYSISFQVKAEDRCVLTPFNSVGLFCLDHLNGKILWKAPGGSSHPILDSPPMLYQSGQGKIYALRKTDGGELWSRELPGEPVFFSPYGDFVVYGSVSRGRIYIANKKNGEEIDSFLFGKGLASPVTVIKASDEAYFFTIEGYIHKVRFVFPSFHSGKILKIPFPG